MVHEILEQHRTGLNRFGRVLGVMGWVLMFSTIVWLGRTIIVFLIHREMSLVREFYYTIRFITPAFFAIGLGQLIRFSLDNKRPGRFLRYGHIVLFTLAALKVVSAIWGVIWILVHLETTYSPGMNMNILNQSFFEFVYAMILFGLGIALRELLPVVEESQTLA